MSEAKPNAGKAFGRRSLPLTRSRWHTPLSATGIVLLLTLIGLAVRLVRLDFQPLWWDEGYSVWFATHTLPQMVELTAKDIHPPLYYALLSLWTRLAGTGPVAIRMLSVLAGTATVPLVYLTAARILNSRRAGLLAATIMAVNPLAVYYSQEVRMYGFVALLSTGILLAAWLALHVDEPRGNTPVRVTQRGSVIWSGPLTAYVILTTAALYTQYYVAFVPIALTLYAILHWRRELRRLAGWLGAHLLIAILYLPWVIYAAPRLVLYVNQKIMADNDLPLGLVMYLARHLAAFVAGHLEGPLTPWWPLALLGLIPLAIGLLAAACKGPRSPLPLLLTVFTTSLILGWLIGLRFPFFPQRGERLLLFALPPFVLLAATGIDGLWQFRRKAGFAALSVVAALSALSLGAFYSVPRYADDDYRPLMARAVQQGLPGDTVLCVYPWQVGYWRTYGDPAGPQALLSPGVEWGPSMRASLDDALLKGRVWFPAHLALGAILETQIEQYLVQRALPFTNEWYGSGTRLSAWANDDFDIQSTPVEARFAAPGGTSVALAGAGFGSSGVHAANEVIPLELSWRAPEQTASLGVSVRLTDDLGQIWAQHDYEPLGRGISSRITAGNDGWDAADRVGLLIPAGTPPGRYRLEVAVSAEAGGRPLEATADEGSRATAVRLAEITVLPAETVLGPERLPVATRASIELSNGIRFLGYTMESAELTPGKLRRMSLFWQANARPDADYMAFVQLVDRTGAPVAMWEAPAGAASPTSQWLPGTLMRTQASFRVPATLPDGRYRLIAGLFRANDGVRARTARGRDELDVGTVVVQGRSHNTNAPTPRFATSAEFDTLARMVGFDLPLSEAPPAPGEIIPITLYWQALATADRPYTVFVHLVDESGVIWGSGDSEPGHGEIPTTGWLEGEYVTDEHAVTIQGNAVSGRYRLAIGLYDPTTGERLLLARGADQLVLDELVEIRERK